MNTRSRRLLIIIAVLIFILSAAATAWAADIPPQLAVSDLERVDFSRADTTYRALFPGIPEDREKIERLLALYNRALASLGPESSFYDKYQDVMPFFLNQVSLSLTDGRSVTLFPSQDGVAIGALTQSRWVTDPLVSKELADLAMSYFVPTKGVEVSARELRMGQQVTVSSDAARSKEVQILLMPSYWPVTIPSAPSPYSIPEAILLATVPVENDRFSYTFIPAEEMGRMMDGSSGRVGPGAWQLVVSSGGGTTMLPVTILPALEPEPRAVVFQRGKVFTWTAGEGLQQGSLADPADQPLLISEAKWGSPITHVSLDFLRDWLGVAVAEAQLGRYSMGGPDLNLAITLGDDKALLNGTMLSLGGTLRDTSGAVRLPWSPDMRPFLGYRVQWLGPETVAFIRGLDRVPQELQKALGPGQVSATRRGRAVTVTLDGKKLNLGNQQAYLDTGRGRVMVPLRAAVEALGGKVDLFPVQPGYRENEAELRLNGGLAPFSEDVQAWVDVALGQNTWRLYLTPAENGTVMVPLRQLAIALGFTVSWDGPESMADLRPGK